MLGVLWIGRPTSGERFKERQMQAAGFIRELLFIHDDHLVLSNNDDFAREELETCVNDICTN